MNSGTLRTIPRTLAGVLLVFCGFSSVFPQAVKAQHAHLSLVSEQLFVASGRSQWIGLRFQLDPGWHIYWSNPGDSGEPPKVTWHLPGGFQAGELQFPAPRRIADHGLTDYGYENDVVLLSKLTVPAGATSNKIDIGADVRYLVCREVCMPGKDQVSLTLAAGQNGTSSPHAELIRTAKAHLPQPLPAQAHVTADRRPDALLITVGGKSAGMGELLDFIPSDAQVMDNSARPMISGSGPAWQIKLKKSEQLDTSISRLRGLLITSIGAYNVDVAVVPKKKNSHNASVPKHS